MEHVESQTQTRKDPDDLSGVLNSLDFLRSQLAGLQSRRDSKDFKNLRDFGGLDAGFQQLANMFLGGTNELSFIVVFLKPNNL